MDEQRHVALPKLYGAPAYARPPVVAANPAPRPIDPDDLPLVAEMTAADLDELEHLDDPTILAVLATLEDLPAAEAPAGEVMAPPTSEMTEPGDPGGAGIDVVPPVVPPADSIRSRPFSIQDLAARIRDPRS